jgi:4-amino-4-deoxy-L-arabinose transferase-like glycosyltransferase
VSAVRPGWPALLAAALVLAAAQLWLRPLLPVDETRYLGVAWEMWWRSDWLVPYLNGEPYSHKPPLLFWLIHALWWLFGVSELAARLLAPLLSLVILWLTARLAARLWPTQREFVAATAPWLLFGGLFWHNFFTLVQFDLLLVLAALVAWHGVLEALQRPLRGWLLVGLAIGFGILSKGPVILVPVLPAALLAPWWTGQLRPARWTGWYLGGLLALLLGAGIALLWAWPAGMAGGESYRQAIFWGQSAGRLVDSFAHRSPWWSYLLWLPLMWLPWVLWPRLWGAAGCARHPDAGMRFCLAVLLPALLVFSLISGKQGKYLLPLFPLLALLMARWLAELPRDNTAYRPHFAGVLLIAGGLALLVARSWPDGPAWLAQIQLLWGLVLLLWGGVLLAMKLTLTGVVRSAALGTVLCSLVMYLALAELVRAPFDLKRTSLTLAELQQSGRQLAYLGKYHGQFHFSGRLAGRIEPLHSRSQLQDWLQAHPDGFLLVNYKKPPEELPGLLLIQSYRGGSLVLWPAAQLRGQRRLLDALPGSG